MQIFNSASGNERLSRYRKETTETQMAFGVGDTIEHYGHYLTKKAVSDLQCCSHDARHYSGPAFVLRSFSYCGRSTRYCSCVIVT